MTKVISISGPSATGKSTLVTELDMKLKGEGLKVKTVPDIYECVWKNLVDKNMFTEFAEIVKDGEYLCVFIYNLLDEYSKSLKDKGSYDVVLLDGCWLDIFIYSNINMWYNHTIKTIQFDILEKISRLKDSVDKIYITKNNLDILKSYPAHTSPFRNYNVKFNRPLELQYYDIATRLSCAEEFKTVDSVLEDFKGYLL